MFMRICVYTYFLEQDQRRYVSKEASEIHMEIQDFSPTSVSGMALERHVQLQIFVFSNYLDVTLH